MCPQHISDQYPKELNIDEDPPGLPGIAAIVVATAGAGIACVVVTGDWLPLVACGAAIVVGLWAVQSINRD